MFQDELNNTQGTMHKHPDDYDLYHVGEFDQDEGTLNPKVKAQLLATGHNLKGV